MLDPHFQNHFHEIGFFVHFIKENSYLGFFLISVCVSYVIPIPEAIMLIFFGYMARKMGFNVGDVILVSIAGGIIGDNALYRLSYFGNKYVEKFNRKMRAHKLIEYEYLVVENIGKAVYFLRLVTGVRFFGPVISGTLGVRWRNFLPLNAGATSLHATFFVLLGYMFHRNILHLAIEVEIIKNILLFSSFFIVGILAKIFSKKI